MLKSVSKISKRRGAKPVKTLFKIDVHSATFPPGSSVQQGWEVSVCFERGGKVASSQDSNFNLLSDGSLEAQFPNTSLSLMVTMYQDSKGNFMEKSGSLILRRKDPPSSYKGIGAVVLPLHYYANRYQSVEENLLLAKCDVEGAGLMVTITPKFMAKGPDDNNSEAPSEFTEITSLAADFGPHGSASCNSKQLLVYYDADDAEASSDCVEKTRSFSVSSMASGGSGGKPSPIPAQRLMSAPAGLGNPHASAGRVRSGSAASSPGDASTTHIRVQPTIDETGLEEQNRLLRLELEDVTQQLVDSRVTVANLHMDLDEERKKYQEMRAHMRDYATRLAALEVSIAEKEDKRSRGLFNCFRPRPDPRRKFGRMLSTDPELLHDRDDDVFTPVSYGTKPMEVSTTDIRLSTDGSSHSTRSASQKEKRAQKPNKRAPPIKKPSWLN